MVYLSFHQIIKARKKPSRKPFFQNRKVTKKYIFFVKIKNLLSILITVKHPTSELAFFFSL